MTSLYISIATVISKDSSPLGPSLSTWLNKLGPVLCGIAVDVLSCYLVCVCVCMHVDVYACVFVWCVYVCNCLTMHGAW